jgi:hypothetical protein
LPTYDLIDSKTNKIEEVFMSISEMEEYLEQNPHIKIVPAAPAIVSGVNMEHKMDSGWKETLQKISEGHPNSPLAGRYGNNKTIKQQKGERIFQRHLNKQLKDKE